MRDRLPVLLAALWWGSLCTTGFLVVPMLFAHLPTPALAGTMAARLFTAQTWLSVACCLLLLLAMRPRDGSVLPPWAGQLLPGVLGGVLLALLLEFAVAPRIVAREQLRLWHTVGSVMYGLQWLCATLVLWRLARRAAPDPS